MDKRKIQTSYFLLGLLGFVLFNYPIIHLMEGKVWLGIPALLIYFSGVVLCISAVGFLIAKRNKE
ncbi:hypothetical protein [uncultured Fluviicola sp.]|uniref:hypothetical protein n=1 Tax=uncultured Fluviicola sp. TaxID=463303 RepID=UPI0025E4906F|nr:hypothetical protein [uncultured Fluviicola sp.]